MARDTNLTKPGLRPDVAAFLDQVERLPPARQMPRGRLVFAIDATMSRQPTWDMASRLQADMFGAAANGLDVQLVSFRGLREFDVRPWACDARSLAQAMDGYKCHGGLTQIGRVLAHVRAEQRRSKVAALVLIGDAVEEPPDRLSDAAGQLGLLGVPCFLFQEGADRKVEAVFRELARLSAGAYARFDAGAAEALRQMLLAVAAYASGGVAALRRLSHESGAARALIEQMDAAASRR